jgi:opacity protein-like surface antigen
MKRFVQSALALTLATMSVTSPAWAQSASEPDTVAVQFTLGATFGNASNASLGGELDFKLGTEWQAFLEAGQMRNVAPGLIEDRAALIAGIIGGSVDAAARATYVDAGIKYLFVPFGGGYTPYVGLGFGVARVKADVAFSVNGAELGEDVLLSRYGVQLGNDLAGTTTKPLVMLGFGISRHFAHRYLLDLSYRFGRIFSKSDDIEDDESINSNRVQVGIGVRF